MKKYIYILLAVFLLAMPFRADAGKHRSYVIGFYNLENLFDTVHDEGKNDYQYLPDGQNQWTEAKYAKKLHNMATVIRAMKEDNGAWHAVLGVSEIEIGTSAEEFTGTSVTAGDRASPLVLGTDNSRT